MIELPPARPPSEDAAERLHDLLEDLATQMRFIAENLAHTTKERLACYLHETADELDQLAGGEVIELGFLSDNTYSGGSP